MVSRYVKVQNPSYENLLSKFETEISEAVKKYLPNLRITNVTLADATESEYGVVVKIEYIITEDVFETTDFVIINL